MTHVHSFDVDIMWEDHRYDDISHRVTSRDDVKYFVHIEMRCRLL